MQKVGSVTETADQNAEFTNGNVAQGVPPTILEAAIFNTWQREMVNIVESAEITLNPQDDGQILKAIQKIVGIGRLLGQKVFINNGVYIPDPLAKKVRITMVGGGGGAGGCQAFSSNETYFGAGGGAGATVISMFTLTGAANYPVVIGSGGTGGTAASNGSNGGTTSFSTVLAAPGGNGGGKSGVSNTNGGAGGVATTGDIRLIGGYGSDGQSGLIAVSGQGGASYFGGGGRAGGGGGISGEAPGSGGGGAYDGGYSGIAMKGGNGASGIVIIEEFS
ncbi:Phage protein [Serratia proteamaculans]|nr:Phage protein [Serratia proteamaculans]